MLYQSFNFQNVPKNYYVYAYLDTRKKGKFKYGDFEFDYEPFYIGKGKNFRAYEHLKRLNSKVKKQNLLKINKIKSIIKETNENPLIVIVRDDLSNVDSSLLEIKLINLIGRIDKKTGPLTNLTNGGEGTTGKVVSEETKKILSEKNKGKNQKKSKYVKSPNYKPSGLGRKFSDLEKAKISDRTIGENNPRAVLDKEKVFEIKNLLKENNLSTRKIAQLYGVSQSTVMSIKHNKIWSHLEF